MTTETKEKLKAALRTLTQQEVRVLELRFGLGGEFPHSRDEVASILGVEPIRVHGTEERALKRIAELVPDASH